MEQRFSMVTLGVESLAESTAFYERLGWVRSQESSNDAVTFFQANGVLLGLYGWAALAEDAGIEPDEKSRFRGTTIAYNTRTKDEVDAVLAEAEQAGATIVKPGQDVFWGGYSGYFSDPDGHLWEVAWNPFFPMGDDGSVTLPAQ